MSNVGKAEYVGMPLPASKHGLVPANAESTQFSFDIYIARLSNRLVLRDSQTGNNRSTVLRLLL